jgi:FkbM family methyltransferase
MGLLSLQAKQYDQALEWLSRAIRQEPQAAYLTSLGTTLLAQGRREEALAAFDKAVQLKPDDADLWRNLGNVLVEVERPADAILSFQHALELDPRHWDAANKVTLLLYQSERFEEALVYFNLCDELQPDQFPTLYMRALTFYNLKRFEEALADNRRAHALDPTNADTCNNIGNVLRSLTRHEEALSWFDRSLELRPNFAATLANKAVSLAELRRFDEAIAAYDRARAIDPSHATTDWNLALLQMLIGNFEAGWAGREARWKIAALSAGYPKLSQPMWPGDEPIAGKTLLICADEGLGDTIQFSRYVPMVAARGAHVILVVQDALCPLLSGLAGVSQCLSKSAGILPPFDLHCALSSLPMAFGTRLDSIPAEKSYLPAPAADRVQDWEDRLGSHDRLRVGLVWSGNPKHNNDRNRSIPLHMLARILDVDATFVSLQKDPRPDDRATLLERSEIVDLTAHLTDFAETAALLSCLDLVITVDTSVAHLAGALGCPTWILLPYTPDYRWLLDRDDSPWYPTVRLFRQTATREYASVLDRTRTELLALISSTKDLRTPTQDELASSAMRFAGGSKPALQPPNSTFDYRRRMMNGATRKLAFVLASSNHGTMIVNRLDYRMVNADRGYGVGFQILETAAFDAAEVNVAVELLALRRRHHGDGVVAIDCGANIGVHTIEWAAAMTGWGSVLSIEAQERIYYALAGNIAINNCFNAIALHAAVSSESGIMKIPNPNYLVPASFGSLELRQRANNEFIGQSVNYTENTVDIRTVALDEFNLPRVDFIKLDIEGMELEALEGAANMIEKSRPILLVEKIKTNAEQLGRWLEGRGYTLREAGINIIAIHSTDKVLVELNSPGRAQ